MNIASALLKITITIFAIEFAAELWIHEIIEEGGTNLSAAMHGILIALATTTVVYFSVIRPYIIKSREVEIESQKAQEVLDEEQSLEETLFNIIHESPIAIGITDENATPVFWNASFRNFGWRKGDSKKSGDFQLMFADPHLRKNLFQRIKDGEEVRREEAEILTASGEPAWVEISIQEMMFEGEKSYLTWVNDITDRKSHEAIQEKARAAAESANRAKSDFLATMSHEIRTPLNGIMTMAEMLEGTRLDLEQAGMATIVRESSQTLLGIINDVLDFSKIESEKLELDSISMSLAQVVEGVSDLLGAKAAEKGIKILTEIDPACHDYFEGDPMRLRQILTNLAGNAVKFTETGEVVIRAFSSGGNDTNENITFQIIDSGIGITPEQQEKLFQPFTQADTSTARRYGGSGLGLSISKALVNVMGGTIGLESIAGSGSTFWFEVPLKKREERRSSRENQFFGKTALVVTDNEKFAKILGTYLSFSGISPTVATSIDAVKREIGEKASAEKVFDTILVDADAQQSMVRDAAAFLAEKASSSRTPLIAMASRSILVSDRPEYLEKFFVTLPMPLRRKQLWEVVAAGFGLESLDGELIYGNREDDQYHAGFAPPDIETARDADALILVAEDNPVNTKVIKLLLDKLGYAAEIVEDGIEALHALREGKYAMLLTDCHMPEMDGYALTSHVRQDEEARGLKRLPIVALTADALIGTGEKCREAGMDAYLKKPISRQELNAVITKYIPHAEGLRRQVTPGNYHGGQTAAPVAAHGPDGATVDATAGATENTDKPVFDISYLNEVTGGDESMEKILLDSYFESTPELLDELVKSSSAGDATSIREAAHAIKGSSMMAGALRLGDICRQIQEYAEDGDVAEASRLALLVEAEYKSFVDAWAQHSGK